MGPGFRLTPVVKNLLIINVGLFALFALFGQEENTMGLIFAYLKGWFMGNPAFIPSQPVTSTFMHASINHLLGNMIGLFFFGAALEMAWGSRKFLIYYMACGVGANLLVMGVDVATFVSITGGELFVPDLDTLKTMVSTEADYWNAGVIWARPTVGASGAIYGLLLAFGVLYPNTQVYLFFAIPVRAKYLVFGLAFFAFVSAFENNPDDLVAHGVHLSGMLIGYFFLRQWGQIKGKLF